MMYCAQWCVLTKRCTTLQIDEEGPSTSDVTDLPHLTIAATAQVTAESVQLLIALTKNMPDEVRVSAISCKAV